MKSLSVFFVVWPVREESGEINRGIGGLMSVRFEQCKPDERRKCPTAPCNASEGDGRNIPTTVIDHSIIGEPLLGDGYVRS